MRVFPIRVPLVGRLLIVSRPVGGDKLSDELVALRREGVSTLVSLLEPQEAAELQLVAEKELCRENGIDFLCSPMPDRGLPPDPNAFRVLARNLAARLHRGEVIAVHCRAGIGRSGLAAAAILVSAGVERADAIPLINDARGVGVPDTDEQRAWIAAFEP